MRGVGVAPGTTTMTLPDGSVVQLVDWIDDKLYGSVELENGDATAVEAFSNGRSQPIPGGSRAQTKVDSNVPKNGDSGLPTSWEMLIYSWGIEPVRVMSTATIGATSVQPRFSTVFGLDRLLYFEFQYNGKAYTSGRLTDYPRGGGIDVTSTATDFERANNGVPSPRDAVSLVLPVHMREGLGYKGVFQPESALSISQSGNTLCDIRVLAKGLIKRSVV